MECVPQFTYLGIPFASSSLFAQASSHMIDRTNMAIGSTMALLGQCRISAWDSQLQLYKSLVKSILVYCVATWGLRYIAKLDQIQISFFKRLLGLVRSTPSVAVRLETGVSPMACEVFRSVLGWLSRLGRMDDKRIPKFCFNKLLETHSRGGGVDPKYNWVTQVDELLKITGCSELIKLNQIDAISKRCINQAVLMAKKHLREKDLTLLSESNFSTFYKSFTLVDGPQPYLLLHNIPFRMIRMIAELRLAGRHFVKFILKNNVCMVKTDLVCECCGVPDDMVHILLHCPKYHDPNQHPTFPDLNCLNRCEVINSCTLLEKILTLRGYK